MIEPRTPVLVGAGVCSQRHEDPARALEPLDLMLNAVRSAAADALPAPHALLAGIGRIAVPKGRWHYRDPAGEIARTIGAMGARTVLAEVGVLQQSLLGDACRAIAQGEVDTALVVGGDAGYRILRARVAGVQATERQQDHEPDERLRAADELLHAAERNAGLKMPVGLYAIIESAFRARHEWTLAEHRERLARLYSRFSEIAAGNPAAWNRRTFDARTIREPSDRNPMQAFPYTKLHCSTWSVDQAGALLLCSAARADALGIPRNKWIFPMASAESNHMVPVSARGDVAACPGAGIAGRAVLEAAGLTLADVDLVDLYSCFPIAVETYAAELGLALTRDVTVTGGMAFAGGPYNNYVIQATCRMAELLRAGHGRHGLVSSVSGVLTKQAYGLWSRHPNPNGFALRDVSDEVARAVQTRPVVDASDEAGKIAGCTVLYDKGQPSRGIAVVDIGRGRTVVHSTDAAIMRRMEAEELCGATAQVASGHTFTL